MYDDNTSHIDRDVDSHIRAADFDRDATAARLRQHHAEGRIDMDEFQQRLDRSYQATTVGQLRELVADLPQAAQRASRYFGRRRLIPLVPILVAILVVSVVSGDGPHGFLFLFLLFPLTRFLLWRSQRGRWNLRGLRSRFGR
ncbi:MAG: DUF1707 domain-containing protein [Actinomycetota bacterium]|nr:DUF1707 domain-containing protein [Actinomycetota bacterium]